MKKINLIALLLILAWACQKESDLASIEDNEYMVYNLSLECRPLETTAGFFLIALEDSVPWLAHIDQLGNNNKLINLSSYLPSSVTFDSLLNLSLSRLANENILVAFSYKDMESEISQEMIQALEIEQSGAIVDELLQPISEDNNKNYTFAAASKNESSDWLVVSSYSELNNDPNLGEQLHLQTNVYKNTGTTIETQNTVQSFTSLSIEQTYTLSNNNILLLLSDFRKGSDPTNTTHSYTLLNILPDASTSQKALNTSFSTIEVVKQTDDGLLLVGTGSESSDPAPVKILQLDNSNNTLWENSLSMEFNFLPTCIQLTDSAYVLGGVINEHLDINWNNLYELPFNRTYLYSFDYNGQMLWNTDQQSEFPTLITGVCESDDGYSWLVTKKSFHTYNNIAITKTSLEGSFN